MQNGREAGLRSFSKRNQFEIRQDSELRRGLSD